MVMGGMSVINVEGIKAGKLKLTDALPLMIPGLVASFLLSVIFSFNEYLFALVLTTRASTTFPIMPATQFTGDSIRFWYLSALVLLNIIPAMLVTIFLERYILCGGHSPTPSSDVSF